MENYWLETAKKLQALVQSGLAYCNNQYDIERYEELRNISADIMAKYADIEIKTVKDLFCNETGYQTPKVDIRGAVFKDNKILMVREKLDGAWALPGGKASIIIRCFFVISLITEPYLPEWVMLVRVSISSISSLTVYLSSSFLLLIFSRIPLVNIRAKNWTNSLPSIV